MAKYIIGFVVFAVITGGILLPTFQSVRESNCGPRDPEGGGFELEQETGGQPEDVAVGEPNIRSQTSSWPNDVAGLIDQLNGWHRDELIRHNEPESSPNQKPSGETVGWIGSHIEKLEKMGVDVQWDKLQKKYVVAEEK